MKKLSKNSQINISILSVLVLVGVGLGSYFLLSKENTLSADLKAKTDVVNIDKPILSLSSIEETIKIGDVWNVVLSGDFQKDGVTSANINLTYSSELLEVVEVKAENGILQNYLKKDIVAENGEINLFFAPQNPVKTQGDVVTVSFQAKQSGKAEVGILYDIDALDSITTFGTMQYKSISPEVTNERIFVDIN